MLFGPLLWFVARDVTTTPSPTSLAVVPRFASQVALAVVVSYLGAAFAVAILVPHFPSNSRLAGSLLHPSDSVLAAFTALVVAGASYLVASTFIAIPGWFDLLATPVGLLVGLPLVVLYGGFVAVANVVPAFQYGLAPFVVVGVGVACSVLWSFVLATIITEKLGWR